MIFIFHQPTCVGIFSISFFVKEKLYTSIIASNEIQCQEKIVDNFLK